MSVKIHGLTRDKFQSQLMSAIADVTGNPIKRPSRINRAMVIALFGPDSNAGNEHTLDAVFSAEAVKTASSNLLRDIQMMVSLHPEIAKDYYACREGLAKAGLEGEEALKPMLALTIWLLREHNSVAFDTLDLKTLFPAEYHAIERLIPDTRVDSGSSLLDEDRWSSILNEAGRSGDLAIQATALAALYSELLDDEGNPPVLRFKNINVYDGLSCIRREFKSECYELTLASIDSALADFEATRSEADMYNL